jgi:hypothetical protein
VSRDFARNASDKQFNSALFAYLAADDRFALWRELACPQPAI